MLTKKIIAVAVLAASGIMTRVEGEGDGSLQQLLAGGKTAGQTTDLASSTTTKTPMVNGGSNFRCEGEITCDLATCKKKLTVAQGTDTSKCKSDIGSQACSRDMDGVQGMECDPLYEPPAPVMNADEIETEQNAVCGAFSANSDVLAKCHEGVQCMHNPDAANCHHGPHGDKDHERREHFDDCIHVKNADGETTEDLKNEAGIEACKDDVKEQAKMEAKLNGQEALFDETFDHSEFDEIFDEIEHMANVRANPCGAFEDDAIEKAKCQKCSGIAHEKGIRAKEHAHAALLEAVERLENEQAHFQHEKQELGREWLDMDMSQHQQADLDEKQGEIDAKQQESDAVGVDINAKLAEQQAAQTELDNALNALISAESDAECMAIRDPERTLHDCLLNAGNEGAAATCQAAAVKNMKQKYGGEVDVSELEQEFEYMQEEVQREKKGDALASALTGCTSKSDKALREDCFNTKMKEQAVALNTTLYELEELVHEEATMQFAEKMNDCANGKGNATTRTAADMTACVDEAVTVAANLLGLNEADFDARDIEDFKEEGARRLAIEERDGCFDQIDPNLSLNEKGIKEAACAAKEEDVFKNVQGIDKDMVFDQDRYERDKTTAAADKMADRFEQCDMDAHRKFKHNATQLDAAINNCINAGIKEYKKLTGETVGESDVLEFKEQAATKQMGDLANKCSSEADRDFKQCNSTSASDLEVQACKDTRSDMKNDCKGQMEDLLSAKLFGGISKEDMTDDQKN